MAQPARQMRADAVRNRARVLEVSYKTFAAQGLSVSVDEIARLAGVGPGTVYRHFPSKEDLVRAVVSDRLQHIVDEGHELLQSGDPGQALFRFMRSLVLKWGATNEGLKHALAGSTILVKIGTAERAFLAVVDELLKVAQNDGTVRTDVSAKDIKALIIGCQAVQTYKSGVAERMLEVVIDGLRPWSGTEVYRRGRTAAKGARGRRSPAKA